MTDELVSQPPPGTPGLVPVAVPPPAEPLTEDEERALAAADARVSLRPLSAAIYGQVVVTSVVAALEIHEESPPLETLVAVTGTILVFWAAHVYAEALASAADRFTAARMLAAESAMVGIAVPTIVVLALGAAGVLTRSESATVSVCVGVFTLMVLGGIGAWRIGHSPARLLWTATLGGVFGVIIVALKVLVH